MMFEKGFAEYRKNKSVQTIAEARADLENRVQTIRKKAPAAFLVGFNRLVEEALRQLDELPGLPNDLGPNEMIEWTVVPNGIALERLSYDFASGKFTGDYEIVETYVEIEDGAEMTLDDFIRLAIVKLLPRWAYTGTADDLSDIRVSAAAAAFFTEPAEGNSFPFNLSGLKGLF